MYTNVTNSTPGPTKSASRAKYAFQNLRDHLPPEKKDIADNLDTVSHSLEAYGASAAATRLLCLDDYATTLPPESLPGLVDSKAALEELEDAAANRYHYLRWTATRNILALVPLLITWWSLSAATSAYESEVRQHPNMVYQPFLILWEHGFDGRIGLTFSAVAGLDTILFVFLIIGTLIIHLFENAGQREARQLVSRIDQSVTQLVAALGQSHVAFSSNPGDWADAVQQVISAAMQETQRLAQTGQSVIQAASATTQAATDAVKASRTGIDQIAEQTREYIAQVKSEFAETIKQLHDDDQTFLAQLQHETNERLAFAFEEASKQMREQFVSITQQVTDEINAVTVASGEAIARAQEAIAQVRQESLDALRQTNAENRQFLADANRERLATQADAADKIDRIAERLRMSAESLQVAIEQHKDGAAALVDSMAKIGNVTQRFGDNMQAFSSTATTMDAHVQEIAQAHERFTQRIGTMETALTSAASATKAATAEMQATTEKMTNALSQATAMSDGVTRASQEWAQAQASLPSVTQAMRDAADNLRNLRTIVNIQVPLVGRWFGKKAS